AALKPETPLRRADGHLKIRDLGLAKRSGVASEGEWGSVPAVSDLTEPGTVMGTAGYMAPEQVRGYTVDHRADIFAFGTILYELLSGRRGVRQGPPAETMGAVLPKE